jgi:hypothetical protein
VPSISGDLAPEDLEGFMPSSLFGSTYIVDLLFELSGITLDEGGMPIEGPIPIDSIVSSTPSKTGITFTVIDPDPFAYIVRVQGVFNEPTFISKYNVVLQGETPNSFIILTDITVLPEDFLAIFRWTPPSDFWYLFTSSYNFIVNPGDISETSATLDQYVYWNWNTGLATFTADLAKGVL